jgi:hypothetical protein
MTLTKVRKTVTLDADLINIYGADDAALSTSVNEALRRDAARQARRAALADYVAELDALFGQPDLDDVTHFSGLLTA